MRVVVHTILNLFLEAPIVVFTRSSQSKLIIKIMMSFNGCSREGGQWTFTESILHSKAEQTILLVCET